MSVATAAPTRGVKASDLAFIAVFAALIAALSLVPAIPFGGFGVPLTLQTLAVSLTGLCLGPWRGFAAVALYIVVGVAGLPVFAGGKAGPAVFAGPTAGYLISFLVVTVAVGLCARWLTRDGVGKLTPLWLWLALVVTRILIVYPIGTLGIMRATGASFGDVWAGDFVFWPGDMFVKSVIAVIVACAVLRAFPRLLR